MYANPRLSPDGPRLALTVLRDGNWDVWVLDLDREVTTRLTFAEGIDSEQVWSPDGEYLVFSSDQDGADSLYRQRADGSGEVERLTTAEKAQWASSWSRDGRYIAFIESDTAIRRRLSGSGDRRDQDVPGRRVRRRVSDFLAGWSVSRLRLERVGNVRDLRPALPERLRKVAGVRGRRTHPRWSADGRELFWRTTRESWWRR